MKYRDIIREIEAAGFFLARQRGTSHRIYKREGWPARVVIAGHPNSDVPAGTLASIRRQAGLSKEQGR